MNKVCKRNHTYSSVLKQCPECKTLYMAEYYSKNKVDWQTSKANRIDEIKEYSKEYYALNRDRLLQKDKEYWAKEENRKRRSERYRTYRKEREAIDPQFKLQRIMRNRLHMAIKNQAKTGSAVRDLGCSIEELKLYLEARFHNKPNSNEPMTWNNHTRGGWNIDHIIPLCSFDLSDREQLLKACHHTNLQPLWEKPNASKATQDKQCRLKKSKHSQNQI